VSHCPYFGAWASDKLGALLHPDMGLKLRRLNLSGCPLQVYECLGGTGCIVGYGSKPDAEAPHPVRLSSTGYCVSGWPTLVRLNTATSLKRICLYSQLTNV